jgi:hypothetical protein
MSTDYIPAKKADLVTWANNLIACAKANATRLSIQTLAFAGLGRPALEQPR